MALVKAIRDIETAIPKLSEGERSGLWHLFRLTELCDRRKAQPTDSPVQNPENLDRSIAALQLAESVSDI